MAIYDTIGATYTSTRRPDPRIAAQIHVALGDAETVIDVGAGTGPATPPQTVLAIEPSAVRRHPRRPARPNGRPAVRDPSRPGPDSHADLLDLDETDVGYRLLVAEL
jgi:hypothetical protein